MEIVFVGFESKIYAEHPFIKWSQGVFQRISSIIFSLSINLMYIIAMMTVGARFNEPEDSLQSVSQRDKECK